MFEKLMQAKEEPGDFVGDDGLLYCGKCRTPKQIRMDANPLTGEKVTTIVPTACRCREEANKAKEDQERLKDFKAKLDRMNASGITCPGSLRYIFADDDGQRPDITSACKRYVDNWDEMERENIGILFYGSVGTGKTFYASCIANALLGKQITATATSFPRLLNLLQGTQEKQKLLDSLAKYKLLILDDLGVERDSSFGLEQIFNVVDARYHAQLPIIVTTNLTLEEMKSPGSVQYARIYDRVLEMCPIGLKLTGDSRRRQNAESRKQFARKIILGEEKAAARAANTDGGKAEHVDHDVSASNNTRFSGGLQA